MTIPGGVVDGPDEGQHRTPALQPVMATAVDLEEHPGSGHPLAPGPMARRSTGPRQGLAGLGQDPPDGPRADGQVDVALLDQDLRQMDRVEPGELGRGELDQAGANDGVGPIDRGPATVAVDERRHTVGPVPIEQAVDLAGRQAQDPARLIRSQLAGEHVVEDIQALLSWAVQGDRLPRLLHEMEGDKVAVPLARTESLSSDSVFCPG